MVLRLGQTVGPLLMGWVLGLGGMDAVLYGGARAGVLVGVAAWFKGEGLTKPFGLSRPP